MISASERVDLESQLIQSFELIFRQQGLGVDADFFELGGDSMAALQLLVEIESRLKIKIPETILVEHPTIAALSSAITHQKSLTEKGNVIPVRQSVGLSPIFVAHDHLGELWAAFNLAPFLNETLPVYGVRPEAKQYTFASFTAIARQNVRSLLDEHPRGDYRLIGYSFGGIMAYEMARQLISRGKRVSFLGIVDIEPTAGKLMRKHRYPDFRERIVRLKERIGKNGIGSTSSFALRWLNDWYLEQKSNQSNGQIISNLVRNSWRRSKYFLTKSSPAFTPKATENSAEQLSHSNTTGVNVFQHKMVNAFYEHSPRKYSGDITHFVTPSSAKFVESRPVSAWSNLTSGSVEIIQIQGDHMSVGKNPDIKQIADRINMLDA